MASTRQRVLALVRQQPNISKAEIADQLKVSRQRVAQILQSEEISAAPGRRGRRPRAKGAVAEAAPAPPNVVPSHIARAGGPAGVMLAAADLMTRGFTIYLPVSPSAAADLVAIDARGQVKRISVQRAKRRPGSELEYEYPKPGDVDVRAMLLTDEPVRYEPEI
jgi:Winged helix-turn-helix DNA-binding